MAIDQKEVEVNDGIIFTIILEGTGNLGLFTLPKVEFHQDLEAFPLMMIIKKMCSEIKLQGLKS